MWLYRFRSLSKKGLPLDFEDGLPPIEYARIGYKHESSHQSDCSGWKWNGNGENSREPTLNPGHVTSHRKPGIGPTLGRYASCCNRMNMGSFIRCDSSDVQEMNVVPSGELSFWS